MARVLHATRARLSLARHRRRHRAARGRASRARCRLTRRPHARPNGAGLPPASTWRRPAAVAVRGADDGAVREPSRDCGGVGPEHVLAAARPQPVRLGPSVRRALAHIGFEPGLIGSFLRAYRQHHEPTKGKHNRADYIWRTVARATRDRAESDDDRSRARPRTTGRRSRPATTSRTASSRRPAAPATASSRPPATPGAEPRDLQHRRQAGRRLARARRARRAAARARFPTELLPPNVRHWIEQQAENMGLPRCVLAVPALVCAAGAIGRGAILQVKQNDPSWTERPCLWSALIMPKGSLKSPALREAAAPLLQAEASLREQWKVEVLVWKARQERDRKGNVKHKEDDPKPPEPKLVVNDTTIEALADAMVMSHGLTLIRDELSGWAANMARYSAKGSDRPFFLECHSGGQYTVDRVMRGRQIVPDTFLCIVGGIQPKVARRLFAAAEGPRTTASSSASASSATRRCRRGPASKTSRRKRRAAARGPGRDAPRQLHVADRVLRPRPVRHPDAFHRRRPAAVPGMVRPAPARARPRPRAADRPDIGFMAKAPGLVCRLAITIHLLRWTEGLADDGNSSTPPAWTPRSPSSSGSADRCTRACAPPSARSRRTRAPAASPTSSGKKLDQDPRRRRDQAELGRAARAPAHPRGPRGPRGHRLAAPAAGHGRGARRPSRRPLDREPQGARRI